MDAATKDQAVDFLKELEKTWNSKLPGPTDMKSWIRDTVAAAKTHDKQKHLRLPEAAFLNGQALPVLFELLKTYGGGLSTDDARRALLNESHPGTPDIAIWSPIHWVRHPFQKILGAKPGDVYRGWTNPDDGRAVARSCPDFSVRDPFPHSILFEGKYFSSGGLKYAQRQLATNIYQAFFYRGLPPLAATKKHPEWKYNYACLMAYDASPLGTLKKAWSDLPLHIRHSFWDGANVYVMILGGSGT